MRPFGYVAAADVPTALRAVADPGVRLLGGGTNLVDLMRQNVERPDVLVDVSRLPLAEVTETTGGTVRIGATARNSQVAADWLIRSRYPMLSQAILSGASAQLRNMATVGGNLMQRTRCAYFSDTAAPCNRRMPSSGCGAMEGLNRGHAVLGTSEHCIATHPSDMCVALAALDAVVEVQSTRGVRRIPLTAFHRPPGDTPHVETELAPDELITAVEIPPLPAAANSRYRKVRDRASFTFALVSVAVALEVRHGMVATVRLALGGVGTTPWRAREAERVLAEAPAGNEAFRAAADAELATAVSRSHNGFKVELARRVIVATLGQLAGQSTP